MLKFRTPLSDNFLLVYITLLLLLLFTPNANSQNIAYANTIPKEFITHRIKCQELKNFILEYDNKFSKYIDPSTGIIVSYNPHGNLLEYTPILEIKSALLYANL